MKVILPIKYECASMNWLNCQCFDCLCHRFVLLQGGAMYGAWLCIFDNDLIGINNYLCSLNNFVLSNWNTLCLNDILFTLYIEFKKLLVCIYVCCMYICNDFLSTQDNCVWFATILVLISVRLPVNWFTKRGKIYVLMNVF